MALVTEDGLAKQWTLQACKAVAKWRRTVKVQWSSGVVRSWQQARKLKGTTQWRRQQQYQGQSQTRGAILNKILGDQEVHNMWTCQSKLHRNRDSGCIWLVIFELIRKAEKASNSSPPWGFPMEFGLKLLAPLYCGLLFVALQLGQVDQIDQIDGLNLKNFELPLYLEIPWNALDIWISFCKVLDEQALQALGFGQRCGHRHLRQLLHCFLHFYHQFASQLTWLAQFLHVCFTFVPYFFICFQFSSKLTWLQIRVQDTEAFPDLRTSQWSKIDDFRAGSRGLREYTEWKSCLYEKYVLYL